MFLGIFYVIILKTYYYLCNTYRNNTTSNEVGKVEKVKIPSIISKLFYDKEFRELYENIISLKKNAKMQIRNDPQNIITLRKSLQTEAGRENLKLLKVKYNVFARKMNELHLTGNAKLYWDNLDKNTQLDFKFIDDYYKNIHEKYNNYYRSIFEKDVVQQMTIIEVLKKNPEITLAKNICNYQWDLAKLQWRMLYYEYTQKNEIFDQYDRKIFKKSTLVVIEKDRKQALDRLGEKQRELEMLLEKNPNLVKYDPKAKLNVLDMKNAITKSKSWFSFSRCDDEIGENRDTVEIVYNSIYQKDFDVIEFMISLFF